MVICESTAVLVHNIFMYMTNIISVIQYIFYSNFIFINDDLTILNNIARALSLYGYAEAYADILSSSISSMVFIPPECINFSTKKSYFSS